MSQSTTQAGPASITRKDSFPLRYPSMTPAPPNLEAKFSRSDASHPVTTATPTTPAITHAAPLPKRPKGRFFISALLLSFLGSGAFFVYDGFIRYAAYGVVVGRKIELAPPWNGVVSALHVRVGDTLRQGDPIFSIDSVGMRHRMEQIEDSLHLERARLGSELARLKWEAESVEDAQQLVRAEFYEQWSELLLEQSVLTDLRQQLTRAEQLMHQQAIAAEKLESLHCRVQGQEKRIEHLTEAVRTLERRVDSDRPIHSALNDQIKPTLVNIENQQSQLRRMRQLLDQGLVTCPANGRVTHVWKHAGEFVNGTDPVVELFVDGSTEIVLYVPQTRSGAWSIGDTLDLYLKPSNEIVSCSVLRLSPEMRKAPDSIMRHYSADESLLPIVLQPMDSSFANELVLGSEVRLPRLNSVSPIQGLASWLRGSSQSTVADTDPDRARAHRRESPNHSSPH